MADLWEPVEVAGMVLGNRVAFRGRCHHRARQGQATPWHHAYYGARALGGVGLVLLEPAVADGPVPEGRLGFGDALSRRAMRKLLAVLQEAGARTAITLTVTGEEDRSRQRLEDACGEAVEVGADAVRLVVADGEPLGRLLSPLGSLLPEGAEEREPPGLAPLVDLVGRIGQVLGSAHPLICRLGVVDGVVGGLVLRQGLLAARALVASGVSLVEVSGGAGRIHAGGPGEAVEWGERAKRARVPVMVGGGIRGRDWAEALVARGRADLVAVGAAMEADPFWARGGPGWAD